MSTNSYLSTTATGQLRTASGGERSGHFERGRGLRTSSTALIDYVSLVLLASLVEIIAKLPLYFLLVHLIY